MALTTLDIILRMSTAIGLGMVLGLERTLAGKTAGMRTYSMITLGSTIFILISEVVISTLSSALIASPLAVATSVVSGIGFIGAGLIIFQGNKISGLTTAAGLWVAAGVGMACGFGLYTLATIATIGAMIIFTIMWFIEDILKKYSYSLEKSRIKVHEKLSELDSSEKNE